MGAQNANCGFCGVLTPTDTMLAGMVACESCLIHEVQTYLSLKADGVIAEALTITPRKAI